MYDKFFKVVGGLLDVPISETMIKELLEIHHFEHFQKGDLILSEGEICDKIYFINKGMVSLYKYIKNEYREHTISVHVEEDFVCSFISFKRNEPSEYCMDALDDCELIAVRKVDLFKMYDKYPQLERAGRMVIEKLYMDFFELNTINITMNAKERYQWLLKHRPKLSAVPIKYLSSLLGIHANSLSRIRTEEQKTQKQKNTT